MRISITADCLLLPASLLLIAVGFPSAVPPCGAQTAPQEPLDEATTETQATETQAPPATLEAKPGAPAAPAPALPPPLPEDAQEALEKGLAALARGRGGRALKAFEDANEETLEAGAGLCVPCLAPWLEAALAEGEAELAGRIAWTLAALATDGGDGAQIETAAIEAALARFPDGGGPELAQGRIALLAALNRWQEIAGLALARLADGDDERRALLCAAETRGTLRGRGQAPGWAARLNARLAAAGWPGPFLVAGDIREPKVRRATYAEAGGLEGAQAVPVMAVIDPRGFPVTVRGLGPHDDGTLRQARDQLHGSFFDPAVERGRRLPVCHPFEIALGVDPDAARRQRLAARRAAREASQRGAGGGETRTFADATLFAAFRDAADPDAVLALIAEHQLAGADPAVRAALCGAHEVEGIGDLDRRLAADGWPGPYLPGGALTAPGRLEAPAPEYTESARAARIQGSVEVLLAVDVAGEPSPVAVLRELPMGLTDAALDALGEWRYEPARRGGEPIPACVKATVVFTLQ